MPWNKPEQRWPRQPDPAKCPVVDVKHYRLTGLRVFVFCSKPRGHTGGCRLAS